MSFTVACVVAARPNFMKMAPVVEALRAHDGIRAPLVHTGQHYDDAMSRVFFDELGMPEPDVNLDAGSGGHARQTARVLERFDDYLDATRPDAVLVAGDVNSTFACALAAAKRTIPVGHVESGLRSGDRTMPEELNRILTDAISDWLFATSSDAVENLLREGVRRPAIHLVGNSMIDSLRRHLPAARARRAPRQFGLEPGAYAVATLHRPSNVDDPAQLRAILDALRELGGLLPVLLPLHPRTAARMESLGANSTISDRLIRTEPLGYLDFLGLMDSARLVLTDSGGIQEETTALGVRCLTLRDSTERPITMTEGTNRLLGSDPGAILPAAREVLSAPASTGRIPALWDGHAGERIAAILARAGRGAGVEKSAPAAV